MSLLVFMFVLLSVLYIRDASGAFMDYILINNDPNYLTLECYSSLTGYLDKGAVIDFFSSPNEDSHMNTSSGGIFNVTPSNEGFFRCTSSHDDDKKSDYVAIAGKWMYTGPLVSPCSKLMRVQ